MGVVAGTQVLWQAWRNDTPAANLPNWGNYSYSPCEWGGIKCEIRNTTTKLNVLVITQLDLWEKGIAGVVPPEICLLSNLEFMSLARNKFRGQVPDVSFLYSLEAL